MVGCWYFGRDLKPCLPLFIGHRTICFGGVVNGGGGRYHFHHGHPHFHPRTVREGVIRYLYPQPQGERVVYVYHEGDGIVFPFIVPKNGMSTVARVDRWSCAQCSTRLCLVLPVDAVFHWIVCLPGYKDGAGALEPSPVP